MKTYLYTAIALCALAGNSILCRLALRQGLIDASSFTSIQLISGVLFLLLVLYVTTSKEIHIVKGNWPAALMLFIYAITFSFAYVLLDTATGPLVLFTAVQITMISVRVMSGAKRQRVELLGLAIAFLGFVYLMLPGLTSPSLHGFILMSISGMA
ncbi:MAG: hypothetical protein KTR16_10665 [Acidiferrobacterales bacterium]|nr:hypothetical protein [Acidiferrobacterales bacterium]